MKRKTTAAVLGMLVILVCGGCMNMATLTDEEMDAVAEYAAQVLLDNVKGYVGLLDPAEQEKVLALSATPTPSPTPTQIPDKNGGQTEEKTPTPAVTPLPDNTQSTMEQLNRVMNREGFSFTYTGYETMPIYMDESGVFMVTAGEGKELWVLTFEVTNETAGKKTLNMIESHDLYSFALNLDTSKTIKPTFHIAEENLIYMDQEFEAGETKKAVVLFEAEPEKEVETAHLTILRSQETDGKKEDYSVIIKLK